MSLARLKILKRNIRYNRPLAFNLSGRDVKVLCDAILINNPTTELLKDIMSRKTFNSTLLMPLSGIDVKNLLDAIACPADNLKIIRRQLRFNTKHEFILTGIHVKLLVDSVEDDSCLAPPGPEAALVLTYGDTSAIPLNAPYLGVINDINNVSEWNTLIGSTFNTVETTATEIRLRDPIDPVILNGFTGDLLILSVVDEIDCVNEIGVSCFSQCTSLVEIDLPVCAGIATFGCEVCTSLTTLNLPQVLTIASTGFSTCTSMEVWNFPLLTSLQESVFMSCTGTTDFYFPSLIEFGPTVSVDDGAFFGIIGNTINLTIPTGLEIEPEVTQLEADNTVTLILV